MASSTLILRSLGRGHLAKPFVLCLERGLSTTSVAHSHTPNAPLELDPSYQSLLKDFDMSISQHKADRSLGNLQPTTPRELEIFITNSPSSDSYMTAEELNFEDTEDMTGTKKSPAAHFGSQRIGAVVLPLELHNSIGKVISESDKPMLHVDAKRLFADGSDWNTAYDVKYKNRQQGVRHAERDGTAFASVALPAHYSAISAVLDHVKLRLGPEWRVQSVVDWGAGTGSGLWASAYAFQGDTSQPESQHEIANSTVRSYLGIDKRDGLVTIGKRLLEGVDCGNLSASWQKSFRGENVVHRSDGGDVLALSAFMLSSLPTPLTRKALVKEMWESGAETMILIDHSNALGFECIAEAREMLLRLGRRDMKDQEAENLTTRGCHVVAPCSHDQTCPLFTPGSSKYVCGFSQRIQRPVFVRKTKHSGIGHEDVGYSYVVIRRGARPSPTQTRVGRVGDVGQRELDKVAATKPMAELFIDEGHQDQEQSNHSADINIVSGSSHSVNQLSGIEERLSQGELESALRLEAYQWPRLVFPPLKKSGHIILDGCTSEGKIMRMTIPRSQGKQPFYDARKSNWGDIFPHEPKNSPQERNIPKRAPTRAGGNKKQDKEAKFTNTPEKRREDRRKLRRTNKLAAVQAE